MAYAFMHFFKKTPRSIVNFIQVSFLLFMVTSCGRPFVKNPPDQPYFYNNRVVIRNNNLKAEEKKALEQKLIAQLDDSSKVITSRKWLFFNTLKKPLRFDTAFCKKSASNIQASLFHLGYYHAQVDDRINQKGHRVSVQYLVNPGSPVLIDSVLHDFSVISDSSIHDLSTNTLLRKKMIVTRLMILAEVNRLVDSFRNRGYYKFTSNEIKVIGDTSSFNQLTDSTRSIQTAKSGIFLAFRINSNADVDRLRKFTTRSIFIFSDETFLANPTDSGIKRIRLPDYTVVTKSLRFNPQAFNGLITLKQGRAYAESDYDQTIRNLSKNNIWKTIGISLHEVPGSDSLDIHVELTPTKKFRFETSLELSYSAASNISNILAGNLFGISGNITLLNRNVRSQGIRMTQNIRAGIELNNRITAGTKLINSNEISYSNTTLFPKLILSGIPHLFSKQKQRSSGETFLNATLSYNTRLNLFNLQSTNLSVGWLGTNRKNWKWSWSPFSVAFSNLLNPSDSFVNILQNNPFLRYSYNTALVGGMNVSFSKSTLKTAESLKKTIENSFRINAEESGLTWGGLPILKKYKRRFIKLDAEYRKTINYRNNSFVFRAFVGVGVPLLGSDTNRTLPFFKQYFGGGSNSMRAWPVRGIGTGGKALVPYTSNRTIFNDRTGDMQLELNVEYRYKLLTIIRNTLTLKGAVFADIGNVWNFRNTNALGGIDSSQFLLKNMYSQTGMAAGTGFRLDFNYFVLRLDLGFRIKRPELFYQNNGWKLPDIGFDDLLPKIFSRGPNDEYRKWRYENFNFTIGIGYAF
ncbi:MAG: BamA/TamA family outer membrane protein [Ferruginibacter sp.]